ncbi:MAG: MBOAT family protein [Lachnospiraceae bacterium]|nr:MBOAT family protein [Lachnospiraceae bacterium]
MLFNSIPFLIFFPIVVTLYMVLPKKVKPVWLLISSYYFYMSWNYKYAGLILFTTVVTYVLGIVISRQKEKSRKKLFLILGLVLNFAVLFLFKYFDFFLDNLNAVLGTVGVSAVSNPFDLLLPVGISFYTFQAVGYCIDVYREDVEPEKNFIKYALFVSFFPQLVAGPIERSKNLIAQINDVTKKNMCSYEKAVSGFGMMLWGLFMKMVIADRVAIFVDEIYDNLYRIGTVEGIVGAAGFSLQIYADFAGYSAIAIGAARVMGFELMENFNTPYFATSVSDFWHRWHISLSTWFRDYVYIPLGGNRKGKARKYLNLIITFLVSGLWHGAAWGYVIWGAIHGVYQVLGDLLKPVRAKICNVLNLRKETTGYKIGQILITDILVGFAWIFFRSKTLRTAGYYLYKMFTNFNPWVISDESLMSWGLDYREIFILLTAVLVLLAVSFIRYKKGIDVGTFLYRQDMIFRWAVFIFLIVSIIVFGEYGINFDSNKFIYFDF